MNKSITIVKDFMSKYNITKKDLFSFCICAVNFLEHMEEECTGDVMMNCPNKYYYVNSNNTRAVAGALSGEKKAKGWTDEEQFSYYMMCVQRILTDKIDERDLHYFLKEYKVFEKVYKRSIMIPFMLGCPVEEYDDSRFSDKKYIRSIAKADNLTIYKASLEDMEAERQVLRDKAAADLAKEVEERVNDKDFSVLLISPCPDGLEYVFKKYNDTYYPNKNYKIIFLKNDQAIIIQTGGKSIEEVRERVLDTVKRSVLILGDDVREDLIPIEDVYETIPQILVDNKVTHLVIYG